MGWSRDDKELSLPDEKLRRFLDLVTLVTLAFLVSVPGLAHTTAPEARRSAGSRSFMCEDKER